MRIYKKVFNNALVASLLLFVAACGSSTQQPKVEEKVAESKPNLFEEPDIFFDEALDNFKNNNAAAAVDNINEAISFMRRIKLEGDSSIASILLFSITELESVRDSLNSGSINDEAQLKEAFGNADGSIAAYHLAIVNDHIINGADDQSDIERLENALVRLEHSVEFKGYQLSEEEIEEIEQIRNSLKASDESSGLLTRLQTLLREVSEKFN